VTTTEPLAVVGGTAAVNAPARPTRLQVPTANFDLSVAPLSVDSKRRVLAPANPEAVGWWRASRDDSPIVFVGHLDSREGPAAFYFVKRLRKGQPISVRFSDGQTKAFVVRSTERVEKNDFPTAKVYVANPGEIRLVTCGGKFNRRTGHYEDNVIVYASVLAS
jgi:Sortase domain